MAGAGAGTSAGAAKPIGQLACKQPAIGRILSNHIISDDHMQPGFSFHVCDMLCCTQYVILSSYVYAIANIVVTAAIVASAPRRNAMP